jgi:DedD protein
VTNQIKQRVIGICVLVFLALILLPWLFDTNKHVVVEEKIAADMPEMIQISKNMSQPVPDEVVNQEPSKVNEQSQTLKSASVADTIQTHDPHKLTLHSINPKKMDVIQDDIVHTFPTNEENINATEERETKPVKSAPETKIKPRNYGRKSHTQIVSKKWTIQLGSFSNKENAQKLLKQLKAKGYCAYTKEGKNAEDELITRVYVGPETDHDTAKADIAKIEKLFRVHGVVKPNL